jgi:hypothetical protein
MPIEKIDAEKKAHSKGFRVVENDASSHILKKRMESIEPKEEIRPAIIPEKKEESLRERITPLRSTESSLKKQERSDTVHSIDV